MSVVASLSIAAVLAFHPYSAPSAGSFLRAGTAGPAAPKDPAPEGEQPGWDEVDADNAAEQVVESSEPPPPTVTPTPGTAPPATAPPPPAKPEYKKGTGLIIGASITGGLAWVVGLTRMAFVKQCTDQLQATEDVPTGTDAAVQCFFKAGVGNAALGVLQVPLNWATWGMAAGAGVVRGRYDGVEQAWLNGESKKTAAFIGAGAALLAVGVIGRITAAALALRPYKNFGTDLANAGTDTAKLDDAIDRFGRSVRGRLFGIQLSSATIGLGAGLLAYGIAYRKNFDSETRRIQQVRFAPQFSIDRASGSSYTGLSLTGKF